MLLFFSLKKKGCDDMHMQSMYVGGYIMSVLLDRY